MRPTSFGGSPGKGARSAASDGGVTDTDIANRAAKEKLWLWPLSPCYSTSRRRQGFLLGFSNTSEEQMPEAVRRFRQAFSA